MTEEPFVHDHTAEMKTSSCCPILELRQYTLHPGMRDVLIELFEREFIESQEALGMTLVGQFRDLDNPDRFVWLRGFPDMTTRAQALQEFYGGPIWKAHREAANATMIDSDNVLLLRPARPASGFSMERTERQPLGAIEKPRGLVVATICHLKDEIGYDFVDFFERKIQSKLTRNGTSLLAYFVTEKHPNTFPALPVREKVNVFVWFSNFPDETTHANSLDRTKSVANELMARLKGPPEILKLLPTPRSRLRG